MNIILCGGGTAGHITPAISIYDFFKKSGYNPRLVVAAKDYSLIPNHYNFNSININAPGNIFKNIAFILRFIPALLKAKDIIEKHKPVCVIGMGGYVSLPVLYMAKRKKIPIFLCEQNSIPGKVNRIFYKHAKCCYLTFSKSLEYMPKGKVFGNPVREDFFVVNRESARNVMRLKENEKLLVIMGGSQGALKLNELFFECIKPIQSKVENLRIVWLAGPKWANQMIEKVNMSKMENITVHSYYRDMPTLMHAADFMVSRAGSSSISEILAVNLPSLLIPFPYAADNHQYFNALDLSNKDMAYLIEEADLDKDKLSNIIIKNLNNAERLQIMRNNIKKNFTAKAVSSIVTNIVNNLETENLKNKK